MIHIGICDDEKKHRELLYDMVSHILFSYDDMEFSYYASGKEVLDAIAQDSFVCELLLLDIHMPEHSGLDIAAYIREHEVDVDIIFVTVSADHVFDGYTYQAFSYLLKPLNVGRMEEELQRYMSLRNHGSHCLHVQVGGRQVQIFLDKVKYFMANNRKVIAFQRGDVEISFYAKIGDVEQMLLEDGFIRCHQSYLVNPQYMQSCSRTEIDVGGETVPVSRRYAEQVKEFFQKKKIIKGGFYEVPE